MTALLMILVAGLLVGRFARRITPPLEVLLFLLVAAIVLVQLVAGHGSSYEGSPPRCGAPDQLSMEIGLP